MKYVNVTGAAKALGVSRNSIYRLIEKHELRAIDVRIGHGRHQWRIAVTELEQFVEARATARQVEEAVHAAFPGVGV